jgi:hypothetical protein
LARFDNCFCVYNNELLRSLENPHPIGDDLPRHCEASHYFWDLQCMSRNCSHAHYLRHMIVSNNIMQYGVNTVNHAGIRFHRFAVLFQKHAVPMQTVLTRYSTSVRRFRKPTTKPKKPRVNRLF